MSFSIIMYQAVVALRVLQSSDVVAQRRSFSYAEDPATGHESVHPIAVCDLHTVLVVRATQLRSHVRAFQRTCRHCIEVSLLCYISAPSHACS